MPPQSRGDASQKVEEPNNTSVSPTSQLHQSSPPAPGAITPGQATPTGFRFTHLDDEHTPTPVRPRFQIQEDVQNDRLDEEEEEDSVDDDDEFESHYSRHDSSASSEEDEDEEQSDTGDEFSQHSHDPSNFDPRAHRVSSMPTSLQSSKLHLHHSYSTTSLPRGAPPIPPPLYPPFYNRPPTPLPPSPSLTSLLRPPSLLTRSTHTTQPPTPDYSDDDHSQSQTPNDTEAAVAHSAHRAHVLPPTAPKVPTYEYYGFTLYLFSTIVFALYILWSYLPSPFLHRIGITYYPDRWWSLAIPAWIVMLLIYIYVALSAWNVEYMTLQLNNLETMVDEAGNVAILDPNGHVIKGGSKKLEADINLEKERRRMFYEHQHSHSHHNHHNNNTANSSYNNNNPTHNNNKSGGTGSTRSKTSTGRKKDRRRREKEREKHGRGKDNSQRFGYMGDVIGGRVANGLTWMQIWNEGTDAVMDVPIGGVCEVLYGDGSDF